MIEILLETKERKLHYEGPNYTADAVIIDPGREKILLIKRGDTGDWALPGGFVDESDESSCRAAIREAQEEAMITLQDEAPLIFRGRVDDPRNSDTSWIETSAHLFTANTAQNVLSGDDADDAAWWDLSDLPPLYASHGTIVQRGLDYLAGTKLVDAALEAETMATATGGFMKYGKYIVESPDNSIFIKQCSPEKDPVLYTYLEKEAFTMAHLRQNGFFHMPNRSILYKDSLMMDALQPKDGWRWQAEQETVSTYINQALEAFSQLESIPLPPDTSTIEPSYISFAKEGWLSIDDAMTQKITSRAQDFIPRLLPNQQAVAERMIMDIERLHELSMEPRAAGKLVFCHHDIRQDNLAWHPEHGIKIVDWSWSGAGEPGSDGTNLLIDLHKSGYDISAYQDRINPHHCLTLIGFWLAHSTWPCRGDDTLRFEQFSSALSAYTLLAQT